MYTTKNKLPLISIAVCNRGQSSKNTIERAIRSLLQKKKIAGKTNAKVSGFIL